MKLISCHIENFGKISNFSMDFSEGMNIIHEPNAWGKSTLATFIKVMFYGFDTKKEAGAFEKERTMYRPWQGGVYGGELDFSVNGHVYRISRTFGKTEKSDEFHIYDLSTNLESVDYTDKVGEELFDLDANSFRRSIFIAQNDCVARTTDAINAKLGNLVENTDDINNYETAQEYLKNLANQMSPNRITGSIKKRKNVLTQLEQELKSYDAAEAAVEELRKNLYEAQKTKETWNKKRDALVKELRLAGEESRKTEQRRNYLVLCEEQQEKLEALVPFTTIFPHGMPDEKELDIRLQDARKLEEEQNSLRHFEFSEEESERYRELSAMFFSNAGEEWVPTEEQIDDILERQSGLSKSKEERTRIQTQLEEREKESLQDNGQPEEKPSGFLGFLIAGIVIALAGVGGEISSILYLHTHMAVPYTMVGSAVVFVFGMVMILLGIRRKTKALQVQQQEQQEWEEIQQNRKEAVQKLQEQEETKTAEILEVLKETKEFLEKCKVNCEPAAYDSRLYSLKGQTQEYLRLKEKKQEYDRMAQQCQTDREALIGYGRRCGFVLSEDITSELTKLKTEAAKYRLAKEAAAAVADRIAEFEARTDMESLLAESEKSYSLEEINEQIHLLDSRIEGTRAAIEQYTRQLEEMQEQLDMRDEKREEYAACKALQEEEMHKHEILTLTQEYLQRAREQFTARYMAPISDAFRKYYELLVGSDKTDWLIDANIEFKRRELGELRTASWMSAGYQDLIGICMRLALVDAMYQGEKPFLIMDDPFVNLDEEKTGCGIELLKKVSAEYQTIYFTCHTSRQP